MIVLCFGCLAQQRLRHACCELSVLPWVLRMPPAVAAEWARAESIDDSAYWGGKWSADGVVAALASLPLKTRAELLRRAHDINASRL